MFTQNVLYKSQISKRAKLNNAQFYAQPNHEKVILYLVKVHCTCKQLNAAFLPDTEHYSKGPDPGSLGNPRGS